MLSNDLDNSANYPIYRSNKDQSNKESNINQQNNVCTRFIRKKFQCIIILLLFLIALSELLNTFITKFDTTFIQSLVEIMYFEKNNSTLKN